MTRNKKKCYEAIWKQQQKTVPRSFDKEERDFKAGIMSLLVTFHVLFHLLLRKPIRIGDSSITDEKRLLQITLISET